MSTASAPGKIILFGEHAVVFGYPALAVPVTQVQARVDITLDAKDSNQPTTDTGSAGTWLDRISLDAPDIGRCGTLSSTRPVSGPDPLAETVRNVCNHLGISDPPALHIRISSSIPVAAGLGSGAAVSVALIRALAASLGRTLSDDAVSQLAFETEVLHHGTPSGIDNSVIAYARPVFFIRDQRIEQLVVGAPFTIVIGDTGIAAETRASVADVRKLWLAEPERIGKIFASIAKIVQEARVDIQQGLIARLGPLMDQNHNLLQELAVSSLELDCLVNAALNASALGAKLSGGGRGGNMIALVPPEKADRVSTAMLSAGARHAIITRVA